MSVSFRPFQSADLWAFEVQDRHKWLVDLIKRRPLDLAQALGPWAFTAVDEHGRVVCCAGALPDGRLWACLGKDLRRHMVQITKFCLAYAKQFIALNGPVWADIDPDHPEAVRWVRLCQFRQVDDTVWVFDARPA